MDDPFDLRPFFREHWPSYGPEWDRAVELGIDISELERNLSLTPEERLLQHEDNLSFIAELREGLSDAPAER